MPMLRRQPARNAVTDPFETLLKGFDENRLTGLLERRPDLADPAPRFLTDLLWQAARLESVRRALNHLDRITLDVTRAAMALKGAADRERIAEALGPPADVPSVAAAIKKAEGLLLLAEKRDGTVRPHATLQHVVSIPSLGPPLEMALARMTVDELKWVARHRLPSERAARKADLVGSLRATLTDPVGIETLIRSAPPEAGDLLRRLAYGGGGVQHHAYDVYCERYGAAKGEGPVEWLAWRGLVVRDENWYTFVVPREVAQVLTGGGPFGKVQAERPSLGPAGDSVGHVDAAAFAAAAGAVEGIEALVAALAHEPARLLKAGGLGIRELRRLATSVGMGEARASLLLELAAAADLVGCSGQHSDGTGQVLPTKEFDRWSERETPGRWIAVATAWLAVERDPSLAGTKGPDGKALPVLQEWPPMSEPPRRREVVLARLAEMDEGTCPPREALLDAVCWDAPLAMGMDPSQAAKRLEWTLTEAAALGLVHHDAMTALGRHLAGGDTDGAAALLAAHAEVQQTELVLQADLTAMLPSAAPRRLREHLGKLADVESKGAALMYRFSEASVRRGFDHGLSAGDILGFLKEHAPRGVPQPLTYLVDDVARRYGAIRIGSARTYVRCRDEVTATEVLHHRKMGRLRLCAITPTVLVSEQAPETVLAALREAGHLPAHEDGVGDLIAERDRDERADRALSGAPRVPPREGGDRERVTTVVRALLSGKSSPPASGSSARRNGGGRNGSAQRVTPSAGVDADILDFLRAFDRGDLGEVERILREAELTARSRGALQAMEDCVRPTAIARGPDMVEELLDHAGVHQWTVRVATASGRDEPQSFCAEIAEVAASRIVLFDYERDEERVVDLDDVAWARVLTEAEEDAMFDRIEMEP